MRSARASATRKLDLQALSQIVVSLVALTILVLLLRCGTT